MNATAVSAPRTPRQRPAPSQRDQQIYLEYQATGKRQADLAADYKLTQCRISQIIRRVEKWVSSCRFQVSSSEVRSEPNSTCNLEPETSNSADAARQLDLRLQREHLNFVCREAIRHFQEQQTTVTHKKGERGDKKFDETTERHHPPSLQCLKVVLQANAQLSRLVSSRQTPSAVASNQNVQAPDDAARREEVEDWLTQKRDEAEQAGRVSVNCGNKVIVRDWLKTLLGEPNNGVAMSILAREAGKKLVDRKPYDDRPPQIPPYPPHPSGVGWWYPIYDSHGSLIAWLNEEQMRAATSACGVDISCLEPASAGGGAQPDLPETAPSTTSPPPADSPQAASSQALAPSTPATDIPPPQEAQVIHILPPVTSFT